jgi:hypothetical protein
LNADFSIFSRKPNAMQEETEPAGLVHGVLID